MALVGILATVLIPNLLGSRLRTNDTAVASVGRQILNAMAAVEVSGNAPSLCGTTVAATPSSSGTEITVVDGVIYVKATANDPDEAAVNAPAPITKVKCTNTNSQFQVDITYTGGSVTTRAFTAAK